MTAINTPSQTDPRPLDEMPPTERAVYVKKLREEAKALPYDPQDDSLDVLFPSNKQRDHQGMALSPETSKLRKEREELSRELESPRPEERAAEDQYWTENRDLLKGQ